MGRLSSRKGWLGFAAVLAAIVGGGCGRIGFSADNGDGTDGGGSFDAAQIVDGNGQVTCGPFGPFQRLDSTVAVDNDDFGSFISNDGLEIVFTSTRRSGRALFQSRRASLLDDFAVPSVLTISAGNNDDDAWMSADGLTLYFNRGVDMMKSVRATRGDPFNDVVSAVAEFSGLMEVNLSADELTFVGTDYSGDRLISIGHRTSAALPFTDLTLQPEINLNDPCCGTLSPDNSQLIYSANSNGLSIATWNGSVFADSVPFTPLGAVVMADAYWSSNGRFLLVSAVVAPSTKLNLFLATADCS